MARRDGGVSVKKTDCVRGRRRSRISQQRETGRGLMEATVPIPPIQSTKVKAVLFFPLHLQIKVPPLHGEQQVAHLLCSEPNITKHDGKNSGSIVNNGMDFQRARKRLLHIYERPQRLFVTPTPGFSKSSEAYLCLSMKSRHQHCYNLVFKGTIITD